MNLWPFMLKSTHREVQLENFTLRSALKEANAGLFKFRRLVGSLRTGHEETTRTIEKIFAEKSH